MKVFHRTYHADTIERKGFRDGSYVLPVLGEQRGVFVSAPWPLDENEGADGDVVLELDIPEDLFVEYEWIEDAKTYREAMIPADLLNTHVGSLRRVSEAEEDAFSDARWKQRWGRPTDARTDAPSVESAS